MAIPCLLNLNVNGKLPHSLSVCGNRVKVWRRASSMAREDTERAARWVGKPDRAILQQSGVA